VAFFGHYLNGFDITPVSKRGRSVGVRNAVIDARIVAKWLEESNNAARKLSKENHDAWVREIEKIRIAVQEQLDAAEINLAMCWLSDCGTTFSCWCGAEHKSPLAHSEGFILCWN
jgi:hypothetical protein